MDRYDYVWLIAASLFFCIRVWEYKLRKGESFLTFNGTTSEGVCEPILTTYSILSHSLGQNGPKKPIRI